MSDGQTPDDASGSGPDRDATIGVSGGHPPAAERHHGPADPDRPASGALGRRGSGRRRRGGGRELVPPAEFQSYYGRPVLKKPTWQARDIAGYLFLGGWAGGSALLAAGADLTGRPVLRRVGRASALAGAGVSFVVLVDDLGRPERFLNMLRVVKPTSPMSMGTWVLMVFGPASGVAAVSEFADRLPLPTSVSRVVATAGRPAGLVAAGAAPLLVTYTAALIANTAVPAWHGAHRELPYLFAGSALAASGGLASALVPASESGPAETLALAGALIDLVVERIVHRRLGMVAETLERGRPGRLMQAARWANAAGSAALIAGTATQQRSLRVLGGSLLFGASICTRFGIFGAGVESAADPRYTVVPQRERLDAGQATG